MDWVYLIGSSPRVWGTRAVVRYGQMADRFIPTCVGNACFCLTFNHVPAVHPHVCGERCLNVNAPKSRNGSSPRVWGTQSQVLSSLIIPRFIPTCVGNASSISTP